MLLRGLAVLALSLSAGACAFSAEEPETCAGPAEPVSVDLLVDTLARHGFELRRLPCEKGTVEPVASLGNISDEVWDTPEGDVIWASDGFVWCYLYEGSFWDERVRRLRDGDYVHMDILNVACSIQESDAGQVERLDRALATLPKLLRAD